MKRGVPILIMALALAGCGTKHGSDAVQVQNVWVRMPSNPDGPGAAYFIVRGGARADSLVRISSTRARRIDLHGPGMRPLGPQPVPPGGELVFAPAGNHAMVFWSERPGYGERVPLTFHFGSGRNLTVRALPVPVGMPDPTFVDPAELNRECVSGVRREGNGFVASSCG